MRKRLSTLLRQTVGNNSPQYLRAILLEQTLNFTKEKNSMLKLTIEEKDKEIRRLKADMRNLEDEIADVECRGLLGILIYLISL